MKTESRENEDDGKVVGEVEVELLGDPGAGDVDAGSQVPWSLGTLEAEEHRVIKQLEETCGDGDMVKVRIPGVRVEVAEGKHAVELSRRLDVVQHLPHL